MKLDEIRDRFKDHGRFPKPRRRPDGQPVLEFASGSEYGAESLEGLGLVEWMVLRDGKIIATFGSDITPTARAALVTPARGKLTSTLWLEEWFTKALRLVAPDRYAATSAKLTNIFTDKSGTPVELAFVINVGPSSFTAVLVKLTSKNASWNLPAPKAESEPPRGG